MVVDMFRIRTARTFYGQLVKDEMSVVYFGTPFGPVITTRSCYAGKPTKTSTGWFLATCILRPLVGMSCWSWSDGFPLTVRARSTTKRLPR